LALILPDSRDREQWQLEAHDDDVGREFVEHWHDLFLIQGKDPVRWRRAAATARPPFRVPGWVLYDGRLGDDGVVELRNVQYRAVELARPDDP
jgi:hypothetical protein